MSKVYAYCRVSTKRQDLQRQIDNICKIYPDAVIYSDKFTGSTLDRPNWNKLYKLLKAGDTIVFDSVSRMSRSASEGAELYTELLQYRNIQEVSRKEHTGDRQRDRRYLYRSYKQSSHDTC